MKKTLLFIIALVGMNTYASAADLVEVYQQALVSDPTYQQAVSQSLADNEGVPISRSQLLPQAAINGGPSLTKFHESAAGGIPEFSTTSRGYSMTLTMTQTVFNYAQFQALAGAHATSKAADATLNAAMQSLMLRVSQAYFAVLKDEDNLVYNRANKAAFAQQYDQINQQYQVGLKTITDVYTARASYDTASAAYISAQTTLADDKENLRAITGNIYPSLSKLSERFPLISPQPADMEAWVQTAEEQNWAVKAQTYSSQAARENIKQQFAGHLPTVSLQGAYNVSYNNNLTGTPFASTSATTTAGAGVVTQPTPFFPPNKAHSSDATVSLNLGIPIFSGGLVVAQTNQARYAYEAATQKLETALRTTINNTRQSYLGIIAGIQQIRADQQAIKSTISSLHGLQAGYRVGTQTLVDVLNQQQKVFQAQTQYATDRYAYVDNLLTLKEAAGTLSEQDLQAINAWLYESESDADTAGINPDEEDNAYRTERKISHPRTLAKKHSHKTQLAKNKKIHLSLNKQFSMGGPDLTLSP